MRTDALLDFLVSPLGIRKKEVLDVEDQILEVSLRSFELARRPVTRLNMSLTPDTVFELIERGRSTWKFDKGRGDAGK